jgi:3',5'-cyclic AMP phosphodiesterase CpdA
MKRHYRTIFLFALMIQMAAAESKRWLVVISDTHFGVGHNPDGKFNNLEDARWPDEFDSFLKAMSSRGDGLTDLIINGDTFELWQSLEASCMYPDTGPRNPDLGCNEADALKRVSRVLKEHAPEMRSLRDFAAAGDNRVILVPGNHDAALLFDGVAKAVVDFIGAPPDRVTVRKEGYWLSPDRLIFTEHGHQIGKDLNRFDHWPTPFIEKDGVRYLQSPWGEQAVQQMVNKYEMTYPIIDNFLEDSVGLGYAFAAAGKKGTFLGGLRFFRMALFQDSLKQLASSLGEPSKGTRAWDEDAIRNQGAQFFIDSIRKDDPMHDVAADSLTPVARLSQDDISSDEIDDICDERAKEENKGEMPPCPVKVEGAVAQALFRSPRAVMTEHLTKTFDALVKADDSTPPFQLFIYSHTHDANPGFNPFDRTHNPWQPRVINTGAWQRVISKDQFEDDLTAQKITAKQAMLQFTPENLPACYDVVVVDPYKNDPKGKLMGWRQAAAGSWSLGARCR